MNFCVLFGLLFCCLACFREGVWTKYTPQDVARWYTQHDQGRSELTPPRSVRARMAVSISGSSRKPAMVAAHSPKAVAPILQDVA